MARNEAIMVFFIFFSLFANCFGVFILGVGEERKFIFSLCHILFHPILAWNKAITVLFYILTFFSIFLKFCISCWVGKKRNDNFYFHTFSAFFNLFGLEMKPFSITLRIGTERNYNFYFLSFSSVPNLFWLQLNP